MSEKVIREFRIIETDDGFRIEIKGDKEQLRQMFSNAQGWDFSRFGGWGHRHGPFGHGHGPFGHHHEHEHEGRKPHEHGFRGRWQARWGYDMGPWWDEPAQGDDPRKEEPPTQM